MKANYSWYENHTPPNPMTNVTNQEDGRGDADNSRNPFLLHDKNSNNNGKSNYIADYSDSDDVDEPDPEPWMEKIADALGFHQIVPGLLRLLDFDGAELWAMCPKTQRIKMCGNNVRDNGVFQWEQYSNLYDFKTGSGLVGRVYLSGSSEWQANVSRLDREIFHRQAGARLHGVKGVVGIGCDTNMGDRVVICLVSQDPMNVSRDRQTFVENMVRRWIMDKRGGSYIVNNGYDSSKKQSQPRRNETMQPTLQRTRQNLPIQNDMMHPANYHFMRQQHAGNRKHLLLKSSTSASSEYTSSGSGQRNATSPPASDQTSGPQNGMFPSGNYPTLQGLTVSSIVLRQNEQTAIFGTWLDQYQGREHEPLYHSKLKLMEMFLSSFGSITDKLPFDGSEIWVEDKPGSGTLFHGTTIAKDKAHREWGTYSSQFKFASDRSLIGRVIKTGDPEYQSDIAALPVSTFVRSPGAKRCGVHGMAGLFHKTDDGLRSVICLFSSRPMTFTDSMKSRIEEYVRMWSIGMSPRDTKCVKLMTRVRSYPKAGGTKPAPSQWEGKEEMSRTSRASICSSSSGDANETSSIKRNRGRRRDRSYTCEYCAKIFQKKGNYQVHLRTHTREKPYSCIDCGRQFTQKSNMKRHRQKIHNVEAPISKKDSASKSGNSVDEDEGEDRDYSPNLEAKNSKSNDKGEIEEPAGSQFREEATHAEGQGAPTELPKEPEGVGPSRGRNSHRVNQDEMGHLVQPRGSHILNRGSYHYGHSKSPVCAPGPRVLHKGSKKRTYEATSNVENAGDSHRPDRKRRSQSSPTSGPNSTLSNFFLGSPSLPIPDPLTSLMSPLQADELTGGPQQGKPTDSLDYFNLPSW